MPKPLDLTGKTFGKLTALEISGRHHDRSMIWRCRCECGNEAHVQSVKLQSGNTRSCGCLRREVAALIPHEQNLIHGHARKKAMTAEYRAWKSMKARCYWPKFVGYHRYGGRGITVCERWRESFEAFLEDVGPRPSAKHSLDRIDNDGNYEPGNCRWADDVAQSNNSVQNRLVKVSGEEMTIATARRKFAPHLSKGTLSARLSRGWTIEQALFQRP